MSTPHSPLTEAEYRGDVELLHAEIDHAIAIFHTREEINRLAAEDQGIRRILDADADFWNVQAHSLQESLFIRLGRILDTDPDAHSIHRIVRTTLGHPEFFSTNALAARKMAGGPKPAWLDGYIAKAWPPSNANELRPLKQRLAEFNRRWEKAYKPIRHQYYAHRVVSSPQAFELFAETNRDEIGAILDFLHDLVDRIQDLYLNGIKPELDRQSYKEYNKSVRSKAERVLRKLAAHYGASETG